MSETPETPYVPPFTGDTDKPAPEPDKPAPEPEREPRHATKSAPPPEGKT
jgi:hypothetical protein